MSHFIGFLPVWVYECFSKLLLWEKLAPQFLHLYGFSPVCIRMCTVKAPLVASSAPHVSHLLSFLPVCFCMCDFRLAFRRNCFPQMSHLNSLSVVTSIFAFCNRFPHPDSDRWWSTWLNAQGQSQCCTGICHQSCETDWTWQLLSMLLKFATWLQTLVTEGCQQSSQVTLLSPETK